MVEREIKNENRLAKMEQKIDNLTDSVKEIHEDLKEHVKWEAEKYDDMDGKYSGKWVEKAIIILLTISCSALLGAVANYLFQK